MLAISTNARHDSAAFFARPGILIEQQVHFPFLVLDATDEGRMQVIVERYAPNLLKYPDATLVLALWPGKHRSDYFAFTVSQIRAHLRTHP